jgi:hypothetical protein
LISALISAASAEEIASRRQQTLPALTTRERKRAGNFWSLSSLLLWVWLLLVDRWLWARNLDLHFGSGVETSFAVLQKGMPSDELLVLVGLNIPDLVFAALR